MTKRRVFILDNHPVVCEALTSLINREEDLETCGEALDLKTALNNIMSSRPDVVVIEIAAEDSDGLALLKEIRRQNPELRILVFSSRDELIYAERALKAEANGYLMKNEAMGTVLLALRRVLSNEVYVSDRIKARILRRQISGTSATTPRLSNLSDRELEIFRLMGEGNSNTQIAAKLNVSRKTVAVHGTNIRTKLGIKTGRELLQYAILYAAQDRPFVS